MTSSIQGWTRTSETERSAINHCPIVPSPLHRAMPIVVSPNSNCHREAAVHLQARRQIHLSASQ